MKQYYVLQTRATARAAEDLFPWVSLETREHVIEVLRAYPTAFVIISHNKSFFASNRH